MLENIAMEEFEPFIIPVLLYDLTWFDKNLSFRSKRSDLLSFFEEVSLAIVYPEIDPKKVLIEAICSWCILEAKSSLAKAGTILWLMPWRKNLIFIFPSPSSLALDDFTSWFEDEYNFSFPISWLRSAHIFFRKIKSARI